MATKKKSALPLTAAPRTVLPGSEKAPLLAPAAVGRPAATAAAKPAPSAAKITVSVIVRRKAAPASITGGHYPRAYPGAMPPTPTPSLVRAFAKHGPHRRA
jgi:hypothetical protein